MHVRVWVLNILSILHPYLNVSMIARTELRYRYYAHTIQYKD